MTRQEREQLKRNQDKGRQEAREIAEQLKRRQTSEAVAYLIAWKMSVTRENESRGLQC